MTLQDLESRLRWELGRGNTLDNNLRAWINEAQQKICWEEPFTFLRSNSTLATVSGTREVALPTGCGDILRIEYDDAPLVEATRSDLLRMYASTDKGEPRHYERTNGSIDIWPLPDAVYSLALRYLTIFTDLSAATDSNALTTGWPLLVVFRAKILGAQGIPDAELEAVANRQYAAEYASALRATLKRANEPMTELSWSPNVVPDRNWRL